jgi:Heavy-metal resistance
VKSSITLITLAAGLAVSGLTSAAPEAAQNPYAGQQARAIKALSEQEVAGLLAGKGAGFARAAELNGYPGPAHVLELAGPLHLDAAQVEATRELMAAHQRRARHLGAELLAAERALDTLFAAKQADSVSIDNATQRVGALQARVRAEHLTTHVTQTALLSAEQVRLYSVLRGYGSAASEASPATGNSAGPGHRH